jgi:regulator of vacuolar morphogenesis
MARKRRNSSSSESDGQPSPKRARPFSIDDFDLDYEPTSTEVVKVNGTYGQKAAFPGLGDDEEGDELFYGPANDGIEYLRMVR